MDTIQALWVGGKLSPWEQLVVKSFLRFGHPFHLYTYDGLENVPDGALVLDANSITSRNDIARFQNLANFSDYFRYTTLLKHGGWWVDMDVVCLKPFMFPSEHILATQLVVQRTNDEVTSCVIKAPKGSPLMAWCLKEVGKIDTMRCGWSAIGPALLLKGHRVFGLQSVVQKHEVFCPLNYFEAPENVLGPTSGNVVFGPETYAVHLWNEERTRKNKDKWGSYPGSLYERLQKEIL